MKRFTLFFIICLSFSKSLKAQNGKTGSAESVYEKEIRSYLSLRNLSAEETEICVGLHLLKKLNSLQTVPIVPNEQFAQSAKKDHGNSILDSTFVCNNMGFEDTPAGTYTAVNAVAGWQVDS